MKKILILLAFLGFFAFTISVNAAQTSALKITSAEYKNEKITVKGTGTGTIQLVLFDLQNSPLYMSTVQTSNGIFEITLPKIDSLVDGDYNIKIADYNGANVDNKILTIKIKKISNPQTSDNILISILVSGICIIGLIGCLIYMKKKENIIL